MLLSKFKNNTTPSFNWMNTKRYLFLFVAVLTLFACNKEEEIIEESVSISPFVGTWIGTTKNDFTLAGGTLNLSVFVRDNGDVNFVTGGGGNFPGKVSEDGNFEGGLDNQAIATKINGLFEATRASGEFESVILETGEKQTGTWFVEKEE